MTELRLIFKDPAAYADKQIEVCGWIRNNRNSNAFGFIELNDGTFFKSVQIVYEKEFLSNFEEVAKLPLSTALEHWYTATLGWNEYLATGANMLLNFVTEFVYQRYFVFGKSLDTRK